MYNTALVFPGQGSQYIGMCNDLIENVPIAKNLFDKASTLFDIDLFSFCKNGPAEDLASTYIAQPVIFLHSIILDAVLKLNNIKISAVAGHSLGEYSALVSCGSLSLNNCLNILKTRCVEMQKANINNKGSMLAIIHDNLNEVRQICDKFSKTVIANINSHNQIIISGPVQQIEDSIQLFKENKIKKVMKLNVSGAFHSPLMNEANVTLNKVINSVNFSDIEIPIYQNVLPTENFEGKEIKNNLLKQLTGSVLWYNIIVNMKKKGINQIIEVGPKTVLSKLTKKIDSTINIIAIDTIEDLKNNGFKIIK